MTPDKELQYQARIMELRGVAAKCCEDGDEWHLGTALFDELKAVLSRPDDLSALEAYVLEEKRKVLREVAAIIRADKCSGESDYATGINDATKKHADVIERMVEGLK